jgi:hypothetical protein
MKEGIMSKIFVLAGLLFNLIGVVLIFLAARQKKEQPIADNGYLTKFNHCFLITGLIHIIAGIIFQMIGVFIN